MIGNENNNNNISGGGRLLVCFMLCIMLLLSVMVYNLRTENVRLKETIQQQDKALSSCLK